MHGKNVDERHGGTSTCVLYAWRDGWKLMGDLTPYASYAKGGGI